MHPTAHRLIGGAALGLLVSVALSVVVLSRLGIGLFIVHTGSMEPTYPSGDLVLVRAGEPYGVGSVITFEHGAGPHDLVTHRVTRITAAGIETKGDGNRSPDAWTIDPAQVHGTVTGALPRMGYVAYYLKQPAGVGSVLTAGFALLLLWGLFFSAGGSRPAFGDDVSDADVTEADGTDVRAASDAPAWRGGPQPLVPQQRRPECDGAGDSVTTGQDR